MNVKKKLEKFRERSSYYGKMGENFQMPRHFSFHSLISTAAHDSQFSGADSAVQSKSLVHPTAKESLSLHCRDTFAYCQRHLYFPLMLMYSQYCHDYHSYIQSYQHNLDARFLGGFISLHLKPIFPASLINHLILLQSTDSFGLVA